MFIFATACEFGPGHKVAFFLKLAALAKLPMTGVANQSLAGDSLHFVKRSLSLLGHRPKPADEKGKQPQNLSSLAVGRSEHLMRKYRLTYDGQ